MTLGDIDFRKSPYENDSYELPKNSVTTCHPSRFTRSSLAVFLFGRALDGRSATHNESDHKKNQKDNEQNPCNLGRGTGDATESQNSGNDSDDEKSNAPT